ncbi:MAG: sulfatase [Opitutales bacterium]|nr:sulfatase [Opitutales bacterium]
MKIKFLLLSIFLESLVFAAPKKFNVLFISADDMNCDLGVYGNSQVKTPNLDRLAKRGVVFERAYCQQSLCGPSRASVMTGMRPEEIGILSNKNDLREKNPKVVTLGQAYRQNGYFSARAGKIYHYGNPSMIGSDGHDDPQTWDERYNPIGIDRSQQESITRYGRGREKDKNLGISMAWWNPVSKDQDHTDGKVASKIIDLIERKKDEPFFLAAGFFNPHCPYVAPKKYFDLYPLEEIEMQDLDEAKRDLEDVPKIALNRDLNHWPYYFADISIEQARKCKQAYFATQSFVDAQVGRLLDALEENDLLDSTIIVFWSDHGYFLGEKGLWYKRKAFERSVRVPLIISVPGMSKGERFSKPVELLDLYPTLIDLCGISSPSTLSGKSLRPVLESPQKNKWKKPAVSLVWYGKSAWGYTIRNERYRYMEWMEGNEGRELYDHSMDPEEVTNLADNSKFSEITALLSKQLKSYVLQAPHLRNP